MQWSWRDVLLAVLFLAPPLALAAASAPADGGAAALRQPFRFAQADGPAAVALGPVLLSPEERAYVATLPVLRVALQRAGAPPYERLSPDGTVSGLQADILAYLARTFGFRVEPVVYPDWPSVIQAMRQGDADMVLTIAATAPRQQYMVFSLGTVHVPVAVLGRVGSSVELDRARVAVEREYFTNDLLARWYPSATVVPADSTVDALQAVAQGAADAYVGSLLEALDALARQPVAQLEVQQILSAGIGHYHFGLRKDLAPLAAILNKGISNWRATPGLQVDPPSAGWQAPAASGVALEPPLSLNATEAALLAQRPVWRVGAVRNLALLNDVDAQGQHTGIAADYTDQIARRLGVGIELVVFDSVAQLLDGARGGLLDLIPFLTYTDERAMEFRYSAPYVEMPYVLVGRSDDTLYWDLSNLRGRRVALAQQHPLRPVIRQRYPDIQVVDVPSGTAAMKAVVRGQAEAAIEVKLFANLFINGEGDGRLRTLGEVTELPAGFAFAARRDDEALIALVDRALADIPAAESERLFRRWVAVDLSPGWPWRRWAPTLAVAGVALLLLAGAAYRRMKQQAAEVQWRRRADEQLDDIGRTMPGVAFRYVLDEKGQLAGTFFSSGAASFLGVKPTRHQTVLDLVAPGLDEQVLADARRSSQQALATGDRFSFTGAYRHPDGRRLWLHAEAVRSTTREQRMAWTGYVIDITEQHELQQRYAREADERHLMLASASHELRAPAHTVAMALQAVPDEGLPPGVAQPLAIAREAARTLGQLLDDVLDAARLDAGKLELRPRAFDLHALLDQLEASYRVVMRERGLAFTVQRDADVPQTIRGDPLRLKQILMNLLSNAAKYTPSGSVALHTRLAVVRPGRAPYLQWEVVDTGRGIAPDLQARLFQPFVSLGPEPAPAPAGTQTAFASSGLGLSICQRLVSLMGGEIQLRSTPGQGTRVEVSLPQVRPLAGDRPLRREGALLLCEDDPVSRLLMLESLRRLGYQVLAAQDGVEALALWRAGDVRLLITDLDMPGVDGFSLVAQLRQEELSATERTGVVVCSGHPVLPQDEQTAVLDCDAFIVKPVSMETLRDTLAELLPVPGEKADRPATT